jgi:hypothetical protein
MIRLPVKKLMQNLERRKLPMNVSLPEDSQRRCGIFIRDTKGKVRLKLYVDKNNQTHIEIWMKMESPSNRPLISSINILIK